MIDHENTRLYSFRFEFLFASMKKSHLKTLISSKQLSHYWFLSSGFYGVQNTIDVIKNTQKKS